MHARPPLRFRTNLTRLTAACILLGVSVSAAASNLLRPFQLKDDFNGNTLGQWACYPPVQDVGYNPSLTPTAEFGALGGRSLMRVVRPPSNGRLRFGFIKKLNAVANGLVNLSFSYRLTAGGPATIEIGFAGADGHLYARHFEANSGAWSRTNTSFRDIPAGVNLEALYITAAFAHGDPDRDYRFLIDNLILQAAEPASFELQTPKATAIFPWTSLLSSSTFTPGETIALRAKAPVRLMKAECLLKDQDNHIVATSAMTREGDSWVNPSVYKVKNSDQTGVWHAELQGITGDGHEITTDLRLLVRSARSNTHPRLYFGAQDHADLMERTHAPGLSPIWSHLTALARNSRTTGSIIDGASLFHLLDTRLLLPTLPGYFDVLNRGSDRILYNALTAYVTGDQAALSVAKETLLAVARWDSWTPPWFQAHGQFTYYPAGELTTVVAFAYDVLYSDLSPTERNLVRQALLARGIKPAYDEYVLDNRIMANTSNWIGHAVGGAIVAAMAILDHDDDPELNTYLGGLLMKFEDHLNASYLSDNSYGEGISYQEFDLKSSTLALAALERVCGIDYWTRTHVKDSLQFPLYTLADPVRDTLDMGDSHPPSGYSIAQLIQHSVDPVMRWYYNKFEHLSINDFLFPPDRSPAKPPSAPGSRIFEQKGNAVFRTGWEPDDAVLLFRAGPNFNHNHADQGSFLLRALGETFASEAGYSDYYKDPYYDTYFSQASGHNTVLVDGDAASQEIADTPQFSALHSYPRITDSITSSFYDAVGSELASVYMGKLKSYTRRIVFLKPQYVVIYDDLATGGAPATFDWLLHVPDRKGVKETPSGVIYQGHNASMSVRALQPGTLQIETRDGHLPFAVFNPAAPRTVPAQPGIVDFNTRSETGSARFLILLAMARTPGEAAESESAAKYIAGSGCIGVQLKDKEIFFRADQSPALVRCGDWQTDAKAWTSAESMISAERATDFSKSGHTMLRSNRPVNFAARYQTDSIDLITSADQPVTIRLHTGFLPTGFSADQYDSRDGTLTIPCPAGRTEITITH